MLASEFAARAGPSLTWKTPVTKEVVTFTIDTPGVRHTSPLTCDNPLSETPEAPRTLQLEVLSACKLLLLILIVISLRTSNCLW